MDQDALARQMTELPRKRSSVLASTCTLCTAEEACFEVYKRLANLNIIYRLHKPWIGHKKGRVDNTTCSGYDLATTPVQWLLG
jgi:hypothetical protein